MPGAYEENVFAAGACGEYRKLAFPQWQRLTVMRVFAARPYHDFLHTLDPALRPSGPDRRARQPEFARRRVRLDLPFEGEALPLEKQHAAFALRSKVLANWAAEVPT